MEKNIINEINRNLNLMGLNDNLIVEGVDRLLDKVGRTALTIFKKYITQGSKDDNAIRNILRGGVDGGFLDRYPKFWSYVKQGQNISTFKFDDVNEVNNLVKNIIDIDSGYFPILFRNFFTKDNKLIDFDTFTFSCNNSDYTNFDNLHLYLHKEFLPILLIHHPREIKSMKMYIYLH
jgi:hypothetical protein